MIQISTYSPTQLPALSDEAAIASFLFQHLEAFGDPLGDIHAAINYALGTNNSLGGLLIIAREGDEIRGAVVVNKTGMSRYIPENILVYIATHSDCRGQGVGKKLMNAALEATSGSIALHVEPDNPAKRLYESLGFTNKYLEMRLQR